MKFCKNCGTELGEGQIFCKSCGHKFEKAVLQETPKLFKSDSVQEIDEHGYKKTKKPVSKKNKWILIAIAAVAVIAVGGHMVLENKFSIQNTAAQFEEAVQAQDVEKAKKVITFSSFPEEVKDEEIRNYLAFLKENQAYITQELENAVSASKRDSISASWTVTHNQNEIVKLVKADKKLGLYQDYKIEAVPFTVIVNSNLEGIEVDFLDKKETLEEELVLTNILPGTYEVKGSFKGEYLELAESTELDFLSAEENKLDAFLEFDGQYVDVYSNEENSTLFINGKSTGKRVGELRELGPIPTDGTIVLHAEYQGEDGMMKTNDIKIMNSDEVYLEFQEQESESKTVNAEAEAQSLEEFIKQYITTGITGMNQGDFSLIEPLLNPAGKAYQESKDYVDYIFSKGIKEDVLSIEVTGYQTTDAVYLVSTIEEYDIHYSNGTTDRKKFSSTYSVTVSDQNEYQVWALESTKEI